MQLESTADVIDALGGIQAVADLFGYHYNVVCHWKTKGYFPAKTYLILHLALDNRSLTAPVDLWNMVKP